METQKVISVFINIYYMAGIVLFRSRGMDYLIMGMVQLGFLLEEDKMNPERI